MENFLQEDFPRAAHLFFAFAWMAGLFYLPRLFVYHATAIADSKADTAVTLATMERRLLRFIMNPAMLLTFTFGIWLMLVKFQHPPLWLQLKFLLLLGLAGFHGVCAKHRRLLANGGGSSARFYKLFNELPTLILALILVLTVFKPF